MKKNIELKLTEFNNSNHAHTQKIQLPEDNIATILIGGQKPGLKIPDIIDGALACDFDGERLFLPQGPYFLLSYPETSLEPLKLADCYVFSDLIIHSNGRLQGASSLWLHGRSGYWWSETNKIPDFIDDSSLVNLPGKLFRMNGRDKVLYELELIVKEDNPIEPITPIITNIDEIPEYDVNQGINLSYLRVPNWNNGKLQGKGIIELGLNDGRSYTIDPVDLTSKKGSLLVKKLAPWVGNVNHELRDGVQKAYSRLETYLGTK